MNLKGGETVKFLAVTGKGQTAWCAAPRGFARIRPSDVKRVRKARGRGRSPAYFSADGNASASALFSRYSTGTNSNVYKYLGT